MKTLAQIRATNALKASRIPGMGLGQKGGNALSGFPMLIKTDGLLAAGAFAVELSPKGEPKQAGAKLIMDAVAEHLASVGICKAGKAKDLVEELAHTEDASQLRRATAEALAFLNYLKRFVV
ncbi:MAG TPA: type III-B CRISPR module-associated protein Cmr5 [Verrucomicrobiota bacterium]|nr:type III-B CRISPR module-associated protein Cmr5 [Verrucomicrobiota bacterium]HQB17903.1 type III-B CRISPR module-associated protein Cmr5 [Verrucomicrobiota bacterium]